MKLKLCAGGDCPLWALAALHAATALPAPIFRQLVDHVTLAAAGGVDDGNEDEILELLKDTHLNNRTESARACAVVRWAVRSAWRAGCSGAALVRDLHVLGAPRHHAAALAEAADRHRAGYLERAGSERFLVNRVTELEVEPGPSGTVDTVELSLRTHDVFTGNDGEHRMLLPRDQGLALLEDLKKAYSKMEQLENM